MAPLIGITCEAVRRREDFSEYDLVCDHRYAAAVTEAGGHPVLLPMASRRPPERRYLEGIDGLVIVGGDDLDPLLYGEAPRKRTRVIFEKRTAFETRLYRAGRRKRLPILGICYGMQLINVLEGGSLSQHLYPRKGAPRVDHGGRQSGDHQVRLLAGTRLKRLLRATTVVVATEHHQGVKRLARGFRVAAVAGDGVIEAMEREGSPELLCVQWHPERRPQSAATRRLFRGFVRACARYRAKAEAARP
jgi:putative glutamine amidotransferase